MASLILLPAARSLASRLAPPASFGWGRPFMPAPAPQQGAERKKTARVRYVVQNVDASTPLSSAQETVWRVRVRQDQNTSGRTFVLYVGQRPEEPAPYDVGGLIDLDPRLLDQE